jgi:hypothetical protein
MIKTGQSACLFSYGHLNAILYMTSSFCMLLYFCNLVKSKMNYTTPTKVACFERKVDTDNSVSTFE